MTPIMIGCTETLLAEIGDPAFKRRAVALTYAFALRAESAGEEVDWSRVNRAIVRRWSRWALEWIKGRAWRAAVGQINRAHPEPVRRAGRFHLPDPNPEESP